MKTLKNLLAGMAGLAIAYSASGLAYADRDAGKIVPEITSRAPVNLELKVQEDLKNVNSTLENIGLYFTDPNFCILETSDKSVLDNLLFRDKSCILTAQNKITFYVPKNKSAMFHFLNGNSYIPVSEKEIFFITITGSQTTDCRLSIRRCKDGSKIFVEGPCSISDGCVTLDYDGTQVRYIENVFDEGDKNREFLGRPVSDYDLSQISPLRVEYPNLIFSVCSENGKAVVRKETVIRNLKDNGIPKVPKAPELPKIPATPKVPEEFRR